MGIRSTLACALLLLAALTGCDSDGAADGDATRIVATTSILSDLTTEVAGPETEVIQLIPEGASPHDFQLSAEDRALLADADLVVANGAGLEAGIPLAESETPTWELADHAGQLLAAASEDQADPHIWMDPTRVAASLPSLADALAQADPARAGAYTRRGRVSARSLRALDRDLRRSFAKIPRDQRALITSHDSLGYLAERYGLEIVATAFPSSGPEAETSATRLDEVLNAIAEHRVATVFAAAEEDPEALETVAAEAGVMIETGLSIEGLGESGSYEGMLRRDAELIVAGLRGSTGE